MQRRPPSQVLGGHGYTRDYSVERYYRDARGLTLHFKTSELLRCDIGKAVLGPSGLPPRRGGGLLRRRLVRADAGRAARPRRPRG
ncbi:MAG: acyl-CoA/acyl-ACP dehydrogenase [Deltaproteobacteria bacterium]|nr:acyl-CoA/acyl-ACP dehydrogenase [Deltaproteobacteria bacterium]